MKAHGSALCTLQKYFYKTHSIETVVTTSRRTYTTTNAQLRLFIILLSVSATITGTATTATTTAATTTTTEIEQLVVPGPQSSNDELTEGKLLHKFKRTNFPRRTHHTTPKRGRRVVPVSPFLCNRPPFSTTPSTPC